MSNNDAELVLRIRGDSQEAQHALEGLEESLKHAFEHPQASLEHLGTMLGECLTAPLGEAIVAFSALGVVVAGTITTLIELTEHAAGAGSAIEKLALKTGTSAEDISALKFAADVTGGSVDVLANSMFMMSKRLEDSGATGDKDRKSVV